MFSYLEGVNIGGSKLFRMGMRWNPRTREQSDFGMTLGLTQSPCITAL